MSNKIRNTQLALNEILKLNLATDGIQGTKTNEALVAFQNKLKDVCMKKNYIFANFVPYAIRMNDSYTDKFTDWLFIIGAGGEPYFFPISTKPASGAESDNNVACLKEGQYLNTWQYCGGGAWTGLPYFQQVKDVTIYRDTYADLKLNRDATLQKGGFGINIHSWKNWLQNILWYKSANRNICLSEGCIVAQSDVWQELLIVINGKYKIGDFFSLTLLHLEDFK